MAGTEKSVVTAFDAHPPELRRYLWLGGDRIHVSNILSSPGANSS